MRKTAAPRTSRHRVAVRHVGQGWELRAGDDRHELSEGDSIYFDSSVPHGYAKNGAQRTTALVVALEPQK